jgi:hypothetical protein
MLNQKLGQVPRLQSAEKALTAIGAMAFAKEVAAEFEKFQNRRRKWLYKFFGKALTSYHKFLGDQVEYQDMLRKDNIYRLREKPELKTTSRLVLYFLTNAQTAAERNTAGKYAPVVDYLHRHHIPSAAAADYVERAGGMNALLKKARAHEALKAAEAQQADHRDTDQAEKPDDADASPSSNATDDLFDPALDLSIRLGREKLAQILDSEIGVDQSFYLECRRMGPVGRFGIRIVGKLLGPSA